ncbi:MAG: exodeoxyribonuclease V subunit gamma, partial [Propionibacteriaceae bacterium]|nr:exodeoxyribonuclease V subunit gamma [Propionibacteriaceae bacterium]
TQTWQPVLWRALVQRLEPQPHPAAARLRAAELVSKVPGRVAAALIKPPEAADLPLIDALLACGAPVWMYRPGVDDGWLRYHAQWPWPNTAPPPTAAPGASLLQSIQAQVATGSVLGPRVVDDSVQIHASHGPSRQVEVLRDVLCTAFDELAGLQPRDVLVLCPDIDTYAPLIESAFAQSVSHPAGGLRVRVTQQRRNPLVDQLIDVLNLGAHRATADDLLSWCRRPGVVRRFGFGPDNLDRLGDLVTQAGVIWGIDRAQRAAAGVPVRGGTWLDGVQRLTLALATNAPVGGQATLPAGGVRSEDADLVGALAELVSRLRRALLETGTPAPLRSWADRLAQIIDDLFAVDTENPWQLEAVNAIIAAWRRNTSDVALTSDDIVDLLRPMASSWGRPSDANGTLQVRRLGDLQGIAFRVICVLGLDDVSFPTRVPLRADDLLTASDARQSSRLALRDALLAARDRFIVMTRGADERTGAALPAPVAIMDLLSLCAVAGTPGSWQPAPDDGASIVHRYALQSYAWAGFTPDGDRPPISYDRLALRAALRLADGAPKPSLPPWHNLTMPDLSSSLITLDDVETCLANPARYLLRQACGLQLPDITQVADDRLPIDLDALGNWTLGQAMVDDLLAGVPPQQARTRALSRPECPPGALGVRAVNGLLNQAFALSQQVLAVGAVDDAVSVDLVWGDVRLGGAVPTRGGAVVVARFGRLKPLQLITCWVRLLAVSASLSHDDAPLTGHAVSSNGRRTLLAPPPSRSRALLCEIAALTRQAAHQLVPLPIETSAALADVFGWAARGTHNGASGDVDRQATDAFAGRFGEGKQPTWQALLGEPSLVNLRRVGPPGVDELSAWLWRPVMDAMQTPREDGQR